MADGISGIHLFSELNEGKKVMPGKKFCDRYPTSTATTLRLTETYHGTGRLVCGDSWFASLKTAVGCREHGLHFTGIVKTATHGFPMKYFVNGAESAAFDGDGGCPKAERGQTITLATVAKGHRVFAHGWNESGRVKGKPQQSSRSSRREA